ncbi:glycosyltransferase family 4 protein [Methanooceanicella nereidis]|nr:glycosyltransferase family 4 protein [Methanocella sp. CWC-04]
MDIALVTTRLTEHDAQGNFTIATASALKSRCDGRVDIYTFAYERPYTGDIGVHYLSGNNSHSILSNVKAAFNTFRNARELSGYDVLLLIGPDIGSIPAVHLAKRYNPALKLLWVYHGQTPAVFLPGIKERLLMRARKAAYLFSMKRSDLVQADSEYISSELSGFGVDPARIIAMPIGVDISRFSSGKGDMVREKYGIGGRFLILYVGRLAALKRVDELIRAVSMMADDASLIIVGGGPERPALESLSKELNVDGRVKFAGRVGDDELPDYYAACDVWATASRHEGFCVPIIEAMASEKPVVVPGVTAMPETAGAAGLVYTPGDLDALAAHIKRLMGDRELYLSLCRAAAERASYFEMSTVLSRYVDMVIGLGKGK